MGHDQRSVMGLVIERLYLGRRPSQAELIRNGSILKRLHTTRGYSWDQCARIVEGLALLRDQGKLLPTIKQKQSVDLRWVWDKDQILNQAEVCQDAVYTTVAPPPAAVVGGPMSSIADILRKVRV